MCLQDQSRRHKARAFRLLKSIHERDQRVQIKTHKVRRKLRELGAGFVPIKVQAFWVAALPMHQSGSGLDDAFEKQAHLRIIGGEPRPFPFFMGMPELLGVEQINSGKVFV